MPEKEEKKEKDTKTCCGSTEMLLPDIVFKPNSGIRLVNPRPPPDD